MRDVDIVEELERLKKKIDSSSKEESNLEGKLESAYERLQTEFGIKDEEEAFAELQRLGEEETKLMDDLSKGFDQLAEEYNLEL
jgi:Skp family chaperone for outer membrane proteins